MSKKALIKGFGSNQRVCGRDLGVIIKINPLNFLLKNSLKFLTVLPTDSLKPFFFILIS